MYRISRHLKVKTLKATLPSITSQDLQASYLVKNNHSYHMDVVQTVLASFPP